MKYFFIVSMVVALIMGNSHPIRAQEFDVRYDSELQSTPKGQINNVNLLYLNAAYPIADNFQLRAATISIAKTRVESLIEDLQGFSNIEADNQLLALAVAGADWRINERNSIFFGIRNVNEDYFTSPATSLFTNSSCGIFPTLACIADNVNYPNSSLGMHYIFTDKLFGLQVSAYKSILLSQAEFTQRDNAYYLGIAYHNETQSNKHLHQSVVWGYTEQQITNYVALIASMSHAFGKDCECKDFVGVGGIYTKWKSSMGLFTDYAHYCNDAEWATELTFRYELTSKISVQTSYHLISHDKWLNVGLVRLSLRI